MNEPCVPTLNENSACIFRVSQAPWVTVHFFVEKKYNSETFLGRLRDCLADTRGRPSMIAKFRAALPLVLTLVGTEALTSPATCEVRADEVIFAGPCIFESLGGADFRVLADNGAIRAEVRNIATRVSASGLSFTSGVGTANLRLSNGWTYQGSIGALSRNGYTNRPGCWGNRVYEVCAWAAPSEATSMKMSRNAKFEGLSEDQLSRLARVFSALERQDRIRIQQMARGQGYRGALDGIWGPGTAAAMPGLIDYFKRDTGLDIDWSDDFGVSLFLRQLALF